MPLPDSTLLSLQVSSNALPSKPKRAMVVRMSTETLDALEAFPNHPPMSVDFGKNPGIYIGDTFFPMRSQKESSPHELYLRAASTAKPMAPLKLYANVVGKFIVERQLGERVTDKVRQQTMVIRQQHMERQAILLDQPLIPAPGSKTGKRKVPGSGTVVKKTPAHPHLASPSTSATRKVSPLPQNPPSSKVSADVRRRLVHCLAILPRLAEDAVRMVGGANMSAPTRKDLLALLEDVGEEVPAKKGDKSPRLWTLKPHTWTEVRPYDWPKLTENERTSMSRQARMIFKALRIPESDPAWENVRYRATTSAAPSVPTPPPMATSNSSRSSTSTQAETKRPAITSKEAKLKSKQDLPRVKGDIQMKDESAKAMTSRVNIIKHDFERPSTPSEGTAMKTVASRRLPGSGYQAKKSPQQLSGIADRPGTPADSRSTPKSLPLKSNTSETPPATGSHARKTISAIPSKPSKKEDEADRERERQLERQKEREREKREREKEKQREEWEREREHERAEAEKREKAKQKEREAIEREKRQKEKERAREREEMERERRQREKDREQEEMEQERRLKEKERMLKEKTSGSAAPTFKRKPAFPDKQGAPTLDDAPTKPPAQKRRKLEDGTPVASSSNSRDPVHKKPAREPSPLKMKKDPSPQASERRAMTSSSIPMHKSERPTKSSGGIKSRRRSPIYTSSEDEGEIPQRNRVLSPPPISDRSNSSDQAASDRGPRHHRPRTSYPPPTDHAALRALYQSHYSEYWWAFGRVVAQKRKIEAMLNGDSDVEDVMDPEELIKLSMEHKSLKTELENIHDLFTKGTVTATVGASMSD